MAGFITGAAQESGFKGIGGRFTRRGLCAAFRIRSPTRITRIGRVDSREPMSVRPVQFGLNCARWM
ncbi:MAG: hypothetical protein ACREUL_15610 [Steroidobacteraceae bacterium]